MKTTKRELIIIFSHLSQLTPKITLIDFGNMRQQKDIIALTEQELKTELKKY